MSIVQEHKHKSLVDWWLYAAIHNNPIAGFAAIHNNPAAASTGNNCISVEYRQWVSRLHARFQEWCNSTNYTVLQFTGKKLVYY